MNDNKTVEQHQKKQKKVKEKDVGKMSDIERAIEIQQMLIKKWENRINGLEEVIKKHPWSSDGLKYDADDWRKFELKRRKEQIKISLTTISALEKQISIKPIPPKTKMRKQYICPTCKGVAGDTYNEYEFCRNCGQKLDWSVEE